MSLIGQRPSPPSRLDEALAFVRTLGTYMDARIEGDGLTIDTREHGSVGDERASQADITEGRRVRDAVTRRFPAVNAGAFPKVEQVHEMGGTDEVAAGVVPGIGAVRLLSTYSGLKIDRSASMFGGSREAVALSSLDPKAIQRAVKG